MPVRAARMHEIGGVPTIDEIDPPSETGLLEVDAAALNPVDVAIGNGRFYGGVPDVPYVIGSEAVARDPDGRRLWIRGRALMAELVEPAVEWRFEVPDGVGDELALACGIAGLTGWLAVSWRAPVTRDDTVLVLGASGTLGSTALQGAKLLGARRVIGAARRTDGVPSIADEVVDLTAGRELPSASVIVDALWGEPFLRALAVAPMGARIVQLGQSAGPEVALQSGSVRGKLVDILGFTLFATPPDVAESGYRELCGHARDGRIAFDIEHYPLEAVGEAWARQASGSPGAKIVVTL